LNARVEGNAGAVGEAVGIYGTFLSTLMFFEDLDYFLGLGHHLINHLQALKGAL